MRRMRLYLAGAMAAALALAVSGIAIGAAGDVVQKMNAKVGPKRLPADDLRNAKIRVKTQTYYEGADGKEDTSRIPPKANKAKIFLADNLEFDISAVRKCRADIGTMTTDEAIAACRNARVGRGSSIVSLPGPGGARVDVEAAVTAFNGPPERTGKAARAVRNPTILLHAYIESLDTTTVLKGVLRDARRRFGHVLVVGIDPIAGGLGAIREFDVTVRRRSYVQGTCPRRDRRMHFKGAFFYSDAPREVAKAGQRCRPV